MYLKLPNIYRELHQQSSPDVSYVSLELLKFKLQQESLTVISIQMLSTLIDKATVQ